MNPHDHDFDLEARRLHAQALQQLSPQVRGRLREARRASATVAPSRHRFGWLLAGGAVAATAALVLALQLRPAAPEPAPAPALAAAPGPAERASQRAELDRELDDMLAALDENPDLYLWLAANDDALPPPSEY